MKEDELFSLLKDIKETGRQVAIIFSKEEAKNYELKKGMTLKITIQKINKGKTK